MILHLFDMSNFVYSGLDMKDSIQRGVREVDGFWEANSMPIGPLKYFFNFIKGVDFTKNIIVPIFDRAPEKKKELYTDIFGDKQSYKGTRVRKNNHVVMYSRMLEWALKSVGFMCQSADGYEADDIIHTIVNLKKDEFEKVYIYTLDSDLSYLISDNVEIKKPNRLGKNINIDNYSLVVRKDKMTVYNTIHLHKLCEGDKSDNIPGIGVNWIPYINECIPMNSSHLLGDLSYSRKVLMEVVKRNPTMENVHLVLPTFKLVTPFDVPEEELSFERSEINYDKFYYFYNGMPKEDDLWGYEDTVLTFIEQYHRDEESIDYDALTVVVDTASSASDDSCWIGEDDK